MPQIVIGITDENDQIALRNARYTRDAAQVAFASAEGTLGSALFATANRLRPDVGASDSLTMQLDAAGENIVLIEKGESK